MNITTLFLCMCMLSTYAGGSASEAVVRVASEAENHIPHACIDSLIKHPPLFDEFSEVTELHYHESHDPQRGASIKCNMTLVRQSENSDIYYVDLNAKNYEHLSNWFKQLSHTGYLFMTLSVYVALNSESQPYLLNTFASVLLTKNIYQRSTFISNNPKVNRTFIAHYHAATNKLYFKYEIENPHIEVFYKAVCRTNRQAGNTECSYAVYIPVSKPINIADSTIQHSLVEMLLPSISSLSAEQLESQSILDAILVHTAKKLEIDITQTSKTEQRSAKLPLVSISLNECITLSDLAIFSRNNKCYLDAIILLNSRNHH